jgi:hypothetical protein
MAIWHPYQAVPSTPLREYYNGCEAILQPMRVFLHTNSFSRFAVDQDEEANCPLDVLCNEAQPVMHDTLRVEVWK